MNSDKIFNPKALEKLRSPDKLDSMIRITGPVGWMGLATVALLCFAIVLWSVYGSFTEKAEGYGLILDSAGVVNISHTVSGKVTVKTGSRVQKGDLVARMEQPEQSADTRMAQYGTELGVNDRDVQSRVYEFDAKRYQQAARENIFSDYEGIVGEVMVAEGQLISAGSPICSIRLTQDRDELQGVFYIGVEKGKRVEPGMTIQLAPNGVDITQTGSLYVLQKDGGAAVEIRFELVKDADSKSGYLWTSVVGHHKPVTAGSYCTGSVVIERQPPIEKVFYKISQWLRSR